MSAFTSAWLALREPADVAARAPEVAEVVAGALARCDAPLVVDIGCGTGSNVRYLASRLPASTRWRLLDHDGSLLAIARNRLDASVETHVVDLAVLEHGVFLGADLVTASALLDLVSASWMKTFVAECQLAGAAVLVVLNYDGRMTCAPTDADDEFVRDLVNRHQRTDKGFGPALGPESGGAVVAALGDAGYRVVTASSDWTLGVAQDDLQRELVTGWASAAIDLSPVDAARIRAWEARRLHFIDAGVSRIVVGHTDVGGIRPCAERPGGPHGRVR